jgi:hypothetical protein
MLGWVQSRSGFLRKDDDDVNDDDNNNNNNNNNNNVIVIGVYVLLPIVSYPPLCSACSYHLTLYIFGATTLHSLNSVPPYYPIPFIVGYFSDIRCSVCSVHTYSHQSLHTTHQTSDFKTCYIRMKTDI